MAIAGDSQFHVLAVDDSLIDRKLIERLLKTSSYQVTTVDSGSKALEFLGLADEDGNNDQPSVSPDNQEVHVNLIITDYCMPGMTGYDLLKKVKQESSSLKDIPVVIMSSENVPSRISRCLEEGAEEFFLKPVQLSDMEKLVPHLLKTKSKDQPPEEPPEEPPEQQQQQSQLSPPQPQHQQSQQSPPHHQQQQQANNKRKTMEESLSPDNRRPRFSGLTVV